MKYLKTFESLIPKEFVHIGTVYGEYLNTNIHEHIKNIFKYKNIYFAYDHYNEDIMMPHYVCVILHSGNHNNNTTREYVKDNGSHIGTSYDEIKKNIDDWYVSKEVNKYNL